MPAITAEGLTKVYGSRKHTVRALDGLDLTVEEGTVLGLLGPNGAGKTTTVRVLATLLRPDSGRATVLGHDVVRDAQRLRQEIGLSGQYAAVDENLTGAENLWMFGRLYQLSSAEARTRAGELLEQFALSDAADRVGEDLLRRHAAAARPGLGADRAAAAAVPGRADHRARPAQPAGHVGGHPRPGPDRSTLLLTTQYLEEADALADEIAVVDAGRIIARGTADELKSQVGGERVEVVVRKPDDVAGARAVLAGVCGGEVTVDEHARRLTAPTAGGTESLVGVLRALDAAGIRWTTSGCAGRPWTTCSCR